jgi:uncharacterized protein with PQ loop repeat
MTPAPSIAIRIVIACVLSPVMSWSVLTVSNFRRTFSLDLPFSNRYSFLAIFTLYQHTAWKIATASWVMLMVASWYRLLDAAVLLSFFCWYTVGFVIWLAYSYELYQRNKDSYTSSRYALTITLAISALMTGIAGTMLFVAQMVSR